MRVVQTHQPYTHIYTPYGHQRAWYYGRMAVYRVPPAHMNNILIRTHNIICYVIRSTNAVLCNVYRLHDLVLYRYQPPYDTIITTVADSPYYDTHTIINVSAILRKNI